MNIVHICPSFFPHGGGVETHVAEVSKELCHRGFEVTIITKSHENHLPEIDSLADISIWRLPTNSAKKTTWFWMWQHRSLVVQADVIQVHDVWWWLIPVLPFVWRKLHITFHGWETEWPIRWQAKLHRLIASWTARTTLHVGAWIQEFYWDKPTAITYGGTLLTPAIKQAIKPDQFVFVGRLAEDTGVKQVCQFIAALKKMKPTTTITWVGDGPLRSDCQNYGQVVGWVTEPQKYTASAQVVIASSYLSILDAQSQGKLVVALFDNPLKERYLETYPGVKWMLMGNQPEELAFELYQLLADKTKLTKYLQGMATFVHAQTWAKVTDVYEQLWTRKTDV